MSDIVKRLRALAKEYHQHRPHYNEAAAEIERLKAALRDCADELESYVEHHYKDTKDYPSELRRYERDIEPVRRARAVLEGKPGPPKDWTPDLSWHGGQGE